MLKRTNISIVFLSIIIFSTNVYSKSVIDSIAAVIAPLPIKSKIDTLMSFTWKYRNIYPKDAIRAAEIVFNLAESIGDAHNKAKSLNYQSVIYRDEGEYEKSLALCARGLDIAQTNDDWVEEAYSNNNIGTIYRLKGNYPLALSYIYKALKIFDDNKDLEGKAFCTYNIGFVYLRQNNYNKALEYLEETARLREEIGDKEGAIKARGRSADAYVELGEYDKAIELYSLVRDSYEQIGDRKSTISMYNGIAKVYEKTNNISKALDERYKGLAISNEFNVIEGIVTNSSAIGLLEAKSGNFKKGKAYLDSALTITNKFNSSVFRLNVYKSYSDFYELQNNYVEAYKYLKLYNNEKDSIAGQEKRTVVAEVEYAYSSNKKERENELIKRDLENQKTIINYWIVISIAFVIISVIIGLLYKSKERANKKLTELNILKDKFFSIVAHDLKNPFHVLLNYSQILDEEKDTMDKEERDEIIASLASSSKSVYALLENLLLWSRSQTNRVSVKSETISTQKIFNEIISVVEEQAKLKEIIIEKDIASDYEIKSDPDIIKTIIRNLVGNAIKYTSKGDSIKLSFKVEENNLVIAIADTGVGIDDNQLPQLFTLSNINSKTGTKGEKGTGLGLVICREFVEKLGGSIWAEKNQPKGSIFSFSIPIK